MANPNGRKTCSTCGVEKPLDEFHKNRTRKDGRSYRCKSCQRENIRTWRQNNPGAHAEHNRKSYRKHREKVVARAREYRARKRDFIRNSDMVRKYGVTLAEVEARRAELDSRCEICHHQCELVVDHDHSTGRFRGLLCTSCNKGLGFFKDDVDLLVDASSYLVHHVKS